MGHQSFPLTKPASLRVSLRLLWKCWLWTALLQEAAGVTLANFSWHLEYWACLGAPDTTWKGKVSGTPGTVAFPPLRIQSLFLLVEWERELSLHSVMLRTAATKQDECCWKECVYRSDSFYPSESNAFWLETCHKVSMWWVSKNVLPIR